MLIGEPKWFIGNLLQTGFLIEKTGFTIEER